jgi:hypothetical protein
MVTLTQMTYLSDQEIQVKIHALTPHTILLNDIIKMDGLPYRGDQIYVPDYKDIKHLILGLYHDSLLTEHLGQQGTITLMQQTYWWKNMTSEIKDYVKGCHTCNTNKQPVQAPAGLMQPLPIPNGPWEWTQSDHITGLPRSQGYDAIYVVMDRLTKMAHFIPTSTTANAEELIQLHLQHVWKLHGVPKIHNTD